MAGLSSQNGSRNPGSGSGLGYTGSTAQKSSGRGVVSSSISQPAPTPAKPAQSYPSLQQAPQAPPTPAAPLVNTSTPNPTVESTVLPALLERAKGGMGAPEAIRLASGATRDAVSGLLKEAEGNAARRGIGGSGAERLMKGDAIARGQRDIANQTANISYSAEQDRNELYKDSASLALASDASQREDRRLGLAQHESGVNQSLDQQRINQNRDSNLISILSSKGMF